MAEGSPPPSAPDAGKESPNDPSPLTKKYTPPVSRRSRRRRAVVVLIVVLGVLTGGWYLWRYLASFESTDDAQVDVHLYPVSARISGYVVKVNVNDNQWVERGTVLV
jgi:membrane fusion protein (multidrug efflux system)